MKHDIHCFPAGLFFDNARFSDEEWKGKYLEELWRNYVVGT